MLSASLEKVLLLIDKQYDIEFPDDKTIVPRPNDSEVDVFKAMPVPQVIDKMLANEFKPNCALVLLDFFIRHGLLTNESDTRFVEVSVTLRKFPCSLLMKATKRSNRFAPGYGTASIYRFRLDNM